MDISEFERLYVARSAGSRVKTPKALDDEFLAGTPTAADFGVQGAIKRHRADQTLKLEQTIFEQRERLAKAERALETKVTKAATESRRIATDKVDQGLRKLADLTRTEWKKRDSRFFPGDYAPVLIVENGQRVVKPMRYQCRIDGKPANYDHRYPGLYNARYENLEGFWKPLFGYSHGILIANAFFENVKRHRLEGRELAPGEVEENVVLEFNPTPDQPMLIACLWSHWSNGKDDDLLSFAAITGEPPPEVAAAGHDRCIIPIQPESIDAWLNPDPNNLAAQYAILDERARPYYEHRLAA
jgi:putative SOS response-associated peptidase YedK